MATITSSTLSSSGVNELLKRLYSPAEIDDCLNLASPALGKCAKKGSATLGGSGLYFPVRVRSAEGHGYVLEDGDFPTPQQTSVLQATTTPKVQLGVVQMTGLSRAVSSGDAMAFATAFDENVQETLMAMGAYDEGVMFRDGTGILATVTTDPGASASGWVFDDVGYLREGMSVTFNDVSAGTDYFGPYVIASIDWPTKTVAFDSAVSATVAVGDTLYLTGTQGPNGTAVASKEPDGIESAIGSVAGSYLGISRANNGNWRGNLITVSAALDEAFLLQGRTRIVQETGIQIQSIGGRFNLLCHQQQADQLFRLALPRVRFAGTDMIDLGNSDDVKFGNIGIVTSHQCPPATAYLGDWSYFQRLYPPGGELHIDTELNGSALKWVSNKDVAAVLLKSYKNMVCKKLPAFVRFGSITTPTR